MRVFVLSTGRNGSMTFYKACEHIDNYSCGHETHIDKIGPERLKYPEDHIEIDNRLSWFLGLLDEKYGNRACYVHLVREREKTVKSHNKRWNYHNSIIRAFCKGILMNRIEKLDRKARKRVAEIYYDTVNANIRSFLKDKDNAMTIRLETAKKDFAAFWEMIDAEGDFRKATQEFEKTHNRTGSEEKSSIRYEIKLFLLGIWRRLTL